MPNQVMTEHKVMHEPDYRFSLANERTFLAWIRTALALLAGGLLLYQYGTSITPVGLRLGLCAGLIMISGAMSMGAYFQWRRYDHAMRQEAPLPKSSLIVALAVTLLVFAMITAGTLVSR